MRKVVFNSVYEFVTVSWENLRGEIGGGAKGYGSNLPTKRFIRTDGNDEK